MELNCQSDKDIDERLFCEIYVHSEECEDVFVDTVCTLLGGERSGYEVETEWAVVDVLENDDYGEEFKEPNDAFLGYRYKLEFEFEVERKASRENYVGNVGRLLSMLWDEKYKAVASCSFEDELPQAGGYKMV